MDDVKIGIDRKTHRLKEECLARKRNQEYRKQLFWNDITNYYKSWDVQAAKYNVWTTQPTTPVSDEKCQQSYEKQLEERRIRLSRLLTEEFLQYEQEFHKSKRSNVNNSQCGYTLPSADSLKNVNIELKLKEEEIRRREARLKKYSQWKISHPAVSSMRNKKFLQESMKKCWNEQMEEKQAQKERERGLALKLEEENARRLLLEEELAKATFAKKKEEMKKLQSYLLMQMEEMKKKDELTQKIKLREQQDIELKRELESIAVHRNQMEKQRRSSELSSFLHHQYQLQLKEKTKKIQEELQEDQRFIVQVSRCIELEDLKNCTIRQEARKQIDRANAVLCEFSRREKQREKEMEFLFFEEAKKLWQKQESRWSAEQEARNNLMRDVLVTIQKQIKEKLEQNAQEHAKLIEEKELLLKNIESANTQLRETDVELKSKKEKYRQDLYSQVQEKRRVNPAIEHEALDVHEESL